GDYDNGPHTVPEDLEEAIRDVVQPLSNLKLNAEQPIGISSPWRPKLSKVDVWYATFGSNMSSSRFFCYIKGGQMEYGEKVVGG
ncbi:hypothetical protein RJ639_014974, partial [Escallonia herrerae]